MQGLRNDKGDIVTLQVLLNNNILINVLSGGGAIRYFLVNKPLAARRQPKTALVSHFFKQLFGFNVLYKKKGGCCMTNVTIVDELVSSKIVAKVLGISARRVQQLTEDGVLTKEERGQYDIAKTVQAFISYKTGESKIEKQNKVSGYDVERTLLTRTKRLIEENKLKIMEGELHRSITVMAIMNRMLNNFKSKLLALPLKAAPKVMGETNLPVIQDILQNEINECLTELSEYDPAMFHDESDDIIIDNEEDEE